MKHTHFFLTLLMVTVIAMPATSAIKVHTIGDSTMADYDENTTDKRGWGMYLGSFFNPEFVIVNNRGKSGADTRQFYTDAAYWSSVKSQMSQGDYLIIQFAHNDEGTITHGLDNLEYLAYCQTIKPDTTLSDKRGTNPQTTYREFLRKFIDEARELGVTPILAGPICRKYFSGNDIRRNGRHDLGDNFWKIENGQLLTGQKLPADDHSMDYVEAMRIVAQEKEVAFIDLTEATRKLYVEYGEKQCTDLLFCKGDNTHTNAMGGNLIARQAAMLLKEAGILADYIDIPTSITANPSSIAIGETYSGIQQNKEFLLTGFGLEPKSGNVTLTATGDLTISTDKESYAKEAIVAYAGGSLFQKVYVRVSYTGEGAQNDTIYINSEEIHLTVFVTASVISLAGGSAVSATWTINTKPIPDAVTAGPITAALTLAHMVATDTKNDITYGDDSAFEMVRFHNADDNGAKANWPTEEIDENAGRYIDFAVTAPATMEVRITSISMLMAAYSTGFMCCHINTGFGDNFTDVKTIYERKNIPNKSVEKVELKPTLTIPAGETLHVRILPWHEHTSNSGKYICLKDVVIEGMAFDPQQEAIDHVSDSQTRGTKVFENGILYIVRPDGTRYTMDGNQVH